MPSAPPIATSVVQPPALLSPDVQSERVTAFVERLIASVPDAVERGAAYLRHRGVAD